MLADDDVQQATEAYVRVEWLYDGLGGSVIQWTHRHGNDNEDPSVLAWILAPGGSEIARADGGTLHSPSAFADWLEQHAATSFPLVDVERYTVLRKEAEMIAARRRLGRTLADLRETAADPDADPEARAEAESLVEALAPHIEWRRRRAAALESSDPPAALEAWTALARDFKGDRVGDEADERVGALRDDDAFQAELRAAAALEKVTAPLQKARPHRGDRPLDLEGCAECREKNADLLAEVGAGLRAVRERWPDSHAAARAGELLERYRLD